MYKAPFHRVAASLATIIAVGVNAWAADIRPAIEPLVTPLLENGEVVGLTVGVICDGNAQVISFGETEKGSGKAPDGKTVYEIGSATKAFTGILLADAVLRGKMKLDDPAQKYLPKQVKTPSFDGKTITLEHLATHTSGLPRLPSNLRPKDPTNPYADYSGKDLAEGLAKLKLNRPPGTYDYSNLGMGLLGQLIVRNAGKSYSELLKERITGPLGMSDTSIQLSASQRERLAPPYSASLEPDHNWDIPTLTGAGAIRSTADDMVKFLQANLKEDQTALGKALQLARTKRCEIEDGGAMGLGWHLHADGITWWHNGQTGGYSSWMSVTPDMGIGVVVLSNTATDKITDLGGEIVHAIATMAKGPPRERQEVAVDPAILEKYVGVYAIIPEFKLSVTLEDGQLMVQATGQRKLPVFAESKTEFFLKVVDAQITFVPGDDGRAKQLILHQNGLDQTARRE
jgi:D-alanyl-D-alanine-carboxypeptidase/D-alanyl-D-alanine-endopeptidase